MQKWVWQHSWFTWGWLFHFQENSNNPLAVSTGRWLMTESMPGSGCLSNDKRFKSTNLQASSSLLITVGDSLAQSPLNLSWLIYSLAHPGHISNAGPTREHDAASHSWLSRLKEPRQDCGDFHRDLDLPCWVRTAQLWSEWIQGRCHLGETTGRVGITASYFILIVNARHCTSLYISQRRQSLAY